MKRLVKKSNDDFDRILRVGQKVEGLVLKINECNFNHELDGANNYIQNSDYQQAKLLLGKIAEKIKGMKIWFDDPTIKPDFINFLKKHQINDHITNIIEYDPSYQLGILYSGLYEISLCLGKNMPNANYTDPLFIEKKMNAIKGIWSHLEQTARQIEEKIYKR